MKISKLTVLRHINTNYRQYAVYTLQHRGIPNFYDSLTNVQRIILLNTPTKTVKTLSVVGDCIKDGYLHGDSGISMAINRLARPFSCSENLLIGDGFFGTQIKPAAAATRYTSVKLNPKISEIILEYKHLINKDNEDNYLPLPTKIPLGLLLPAVGIAVGYKTQILPRKLEHLYEFIEGKRKTCKPYFKNFNGEIKQFKDLENSWIIEGEIVIDDENRSIYIKSLPPLMKYESFVKKLSSILDGFEEVKIVNNSKIDVDIKIILHKYLADNIWEQIRDKIIKSTKMIVRECIIFIKDNQVLEYENIENYLEDYIIQNKFTEKLHLEYLYKYYSDENEFYKAKKRFLKFMFGTKRTDAEVKDFYKSYDESISNRLDNIKARNITEDELKLVEKKLEETSDLMTETKINLIDFTKYLEELPRELHIKVKKESKLFEYEQDEFDGIEIFSGNYDEEKSEEEKNEEENFEIENIEL